MAPSSTPKKDEEYGKETTDDTLSAIKKLLDTGGDALQFAPIPGLDIAAKVLSGFIEQIQVGLPLEGRHCAENKSWFAGNRTKRETAEGADREYTGSLGYGQQGI